ncbi:MAG TPA: ABC transporter ATP-binding protein [Gaiellaceae bacterium]|nr:ABC transporter ATP-binding protein [Gaiellaceae bacterium]
MTDQESDLSFAQTRAILARAVGLFRPYRRSIVAVAATIVVSSGLSVMNPLLIRAIFDDALFPRHGQANVHLLLELVGVLIAVAAATSGAGVLQTYMATRIGQSVMRDLRTGLYRNLKRMPLRFFTDTRTGEIQSRLTNDVGQIDDVITHVAQDSLANVVILISSLVAMLVMSWQLTVLTFCVVPFFAWLTHRTGRSGHKKWKAVQESLADMTAVTEETLSVSGVLLAKVFGRDADDVRRFGELNERLSRLQTIARVNGRVFWAWVGIFFSTAPAGVFLLAALSLRHGGQSISPGTIVAFTTLQGRLFWPVGELFHYAIEIRSSFAMLERIFAYLDLEPELRESGTARTLAPERVQGAIELREVTFTYPGAERPAVEGVDVRVEPGQLAALVGPTGAGKTTLSYLIARLYDPERGAVLLDEHDLRELTLETLPAVIGMVTQDTYLFHDTVRANLLYAKPGAGDDELETAARSAYIHDRIMELPMQYDTVVGERGYRLSGGEKQRLAIARALLKNPRVLVLDEATSALDTNSERIVQRALAPLIGSRTTIAIAHRLSTIIAADVIFVLDRGKLVERGTHTELVAREGLYARLYREQFSSGSVEAVCSDGIVLAEAAD